MPIVSKGVISHKCDILIPKGRNRPQPVLNDRRQVFHTSEVEEALAQGVTEYRAGRGTREVEAILRQKAGEVLARLPDLTAEGFVPGMVDLKSDARLPRDYESSVIVSKFYQSGLVPGDVALLEDLKTILNAYQGIVESMNEASSGPEQADQIIDEKVSAAELAKYFHQNQGLSFSPYQVAAFITALQAKGFVILSGISGTGKSQLAVQTGKLVLGEQPDSYPVRPDWRDSRALLGFFNPLTGRYSSTPLLRSLLPDKGTQPTPVARTVHIDRLRDSIKQNKEWTRDLQDFVPRFEQTAAKDLSDDDIAELWVPGVNPIASIGQAISHKLVGDQKVLRAATEILASGQSPGSRLVAALTFLREHGNVWQAARVLRALAAFAWDQTSTIANVGALRTVIQALGYSSTAKVDNADAESMDKAFSFLRRRIDEELPDLDRYEKSIAPWLLFEQLTNPVESSSRRSADTQEHRFIILDEMNLARVEYYFAEFLSVLESSRNADGTTIQGLPLHDQQTHVKDGPEDDPATNDIPPSLVLPPHLYVVGTVNTDETTHAFSPKVLDRAFTIEFQEVDLTALPGTTALETDAVDSIRRSVIALLALANSPGRQVARARAFADPRFLPWLSSLNERLHPFDLHFAYRVRDEIGAFVGFVLDSSLADGFGDEPFVGAFDTAVLMKVLPKFHGPRAQMSEPLTRVLAWAVNPDAPDVTLEPLRQTMESRGLQDSLSLFKALPAEEIPVLERTSYKVARMLYQAMTTGFTSFN